MNGRIGELLIILLVVLIFFGAGKLPRVMRDLGRGLRSFREGLNGDTSEAAGGSGIGNGGDGDKEGQQR